MKNVTVTLFEETVRWVRAASRRAEPERSSRLAEQVERMRCGDDHYEIAMTSALARKPCRMEWIDGRRPTREELHDRAGSR